MDALTREYLEKKLEADIFCAIGATCNITNKETPLPCDTCKYAEPCSKFDLTEAVKLGIKKMLENNQQG